ncbi:MAG: ATP-binding protein [bacterium]
MQKQFVSIQRKLISLSIIVLVTITIVIIIITGFVNFIETRHQLNEMTNANRQSLIRKGKTLVSNNSKVLRTFVTDNAFLDIRELVSATVKEDPDVVYGIYMDSERRPWAVANDSIADGTPLTFDPLEDTLSLWAESQEEVASRAVNSDKNQVIEFAAPVVAEGERLGTIRYGISMAATQKIINALKKDAHKSFIRIFFIFSAFLGCVLAFSLFAMCRQAQSIISPLKELTQAANEISQGNYSEEITTVTNDEVGVLASNLETMRQTIKQYTENLEQMVAERTKQLEAAQKELVEKAHKAGMADIITGTLHNVGNILNSVKTSVEIINTIIQSSSLHGFKKANSLLRENFETIEIFISKDPKGKKLLAYYLKLEEAITDENGELLENTRRLMDKTNAIIDVIVAQQNYAGGAILTEDVNLSEILEDALTMQQGSIERYNIDIKRDFMKIPKVRIQKTKFMHVLINLIKNAKEAMIATPAEKRSLTFSLNKDNSNVFLKIIDVGTGITKENLVKIFTHGFTTKADGHGFGLHSSANYMKEMGGSLHAESQGEGHGATFVIRIPCTE